MRPGAVGRCGVCACARARAGGCGLVVEIKKEKTETVDVCHKLYSTTGTKTRYDFLSRI